MSEHLNGIPGNMKISSLRKMVEIAYESVEARRREKSTLEKVEHVPLPRPVDIFMAGQVLYYLDLLAKELATVEAWFKAAEDEEQIDVGEFINALKPFAISFEISPATGAVIITRAAKIVRTERETYCG